MSDAILEAGFTLQQKAFALQAAFTLNPGEILVIQGPSGSGKTTLLRCLAGLDKPQSGFLRVQGATWQDATHFLPTHQRNIGYVFQEDSLLPHLNAKQNILLGINAQKPVSEELAQLVDLLGIKDLLHRYPAELSGGERQRIAIARACAARAQLLLMDEPLAALDNTRKSAALGGIKALCKAWSTPLVYVTHDMAEAHYLADIRLQLTNGLLENPPPRSNLVARGPLSA